MSSEPIRTSSPPSSSAIPIPHTIRTEIQHWSVVGTRVWQWRQPQHLWVIEEAVVGVVAHFLKGEQLARQPRVQSLRRLIIDIETEIDLFTRLTRGRLAANPDYVALQQLPGIGPVLGAVFLAEVGDVTRFRNAAQLACWAG